MHMVGHHYEIAQVISLAVEMVQTLGHDPSQIRSPEHARAVSLVEILQELSRKGDVELVLFSLGQCPQPRLPIVSERIDPATLEPVGAAQVPGVGYLGGNGVLG